MIFADFFGDPVYFESWEKMAKVLKMSLIDSMLSINKVSSAYYVNLNIL